MERKSGDSDWKLKTSAWCVLTTKSTGNNENKTTKCFRLWVGLQCPSHTVTAAASLVVQVGPALFEYGFRRNWPLSKVFSKSHSYLSCVDFPVSLEIHITLDLKEFYLVFAFSNYAGGTCMPEILLHRVIRYLPLCMFSRWRSAGAERPGPRL